MAGRFIQRSRHGTVFYFRRRVPHDLQGKIGRAHIYVSLRTEEMAPALRAARALAVATDQLFLQLRYAPDRTHASLADRSGPLVGIAKNTLEKATDWGGTHNNRIIEHQFVRDMKTTLDSFTLDYELTFEVDAQRNSKFVFTDVKPGEEGAMEDAARRLLGLSKPSEIAPAGPITPTVAEAIQTVLRDPGTKASSKKEYKRAFAFFAEFIGEDTRLADIPQERFAEFVDYVESSMDRAAKTRTFYIVSAQRLFTYYASRNSNVPRITTAGLKPKREAPAGHDRDAYTVAELEAIFQHLRRLRDSEPAKWWVTVASAFLGTRIEELAQAQLDGDFIRDPESGVYFLQIDEQCRSSCPRTQASPKSVKSKAGWRRVPIHPVLQEAGFLEYLEGERKAGAVTPFERQWLPLRAGGGRVKHGHYISKWGGRDMMSELIEKKILGRRLAYFHSMRHSFITILAKEGIAVEWRSALAGHGYGGVNSEVYTKKQDVAFTLPLLERGLRPLEEALRRVLAAS